MIVDEWAKVLDRGESEAIVLEEELRCSAILMDEAARRHVALRKENSITKRRMGKPRPGS